MTGPSSETLPTSVTRRLNETFYRGAPPHTYFELRLLSVLAIDSQSNDEEELPRSTLAENVVGRELEFDPETLERPAIETYIAAESQVLLHHAGEALVRFVLGHLDGPPCPWFEIASLKDFRVFKAAAAELATVDVDALSRQLDKFMFGGAVDDEPDRRATLVSVTAEAVAGAAQRVLADANLYNAAKHGFAVLAGRTAVEWRKEVTGDESKDELDARRKIEEWLDDEGLTLETLEWVRDEEAKVRRWRTVLRFVDVDHDLALTWLIVQSLGNLWRVARARYSGGGDVRYYMLDDTLTPREFRERAPGKGTVMTVPIMAMPLPDDQAADVLAKTRRHRSMETEQEQ